MDGHKQARTIIISKPVKGHSPRILSISVELIRRLELLEKMPESSTHSHSTEISIIAAK